MDCFHESIDKLILSLEHLLNKYVDDKHVRRFSRLGLSITCTSSWVVGGNVNLRQKCDRYFDRPVP